MYWCSLVKAQLRAYLCRELIREDLQEQLLYMDDDIQVSTMRLTDMPRSKSLPSSTVERQAESRERIRDKVNAEIAKFDKSCERMAKALLSLGEVEYTVITQLFFSVDFSDSELAADLRISVNELERIRESGLGKLYDIIFAQERGHRRHQYKREIRVLQAT